MSDLSFVVVGRRGLLAGEAEACLRRAGVQVQRVSQADLDAVGGRPDVIIYTSAMTDVDGCFRDPIKGIEYTNLWLQKWVERFARLSVRGCQLLGDEEERNDSYRLSVNGAARPGREGGAGAPGSAGEERVRGREQGARSTGRGVPRTDNNGLAGARPVKFVYISSGGIFDGAPKAIKEDDVRGPIHPYGIVKALAEFQVMNSGLKDWMIVRTDDLFSKDRIFNYPKGVTDKYNKPTYAPDVAAAILKLIGIDFRGIIHVCGPELMSKFDCIKYFNPAVEPVTMAELNLPSPRPQYENLDTSLAESLGIRVRSLAEAMRAISAERGAWRMAQGAGSAEEE